jgi:hypothetical protein
MAKTFLCDPGQVRVLEFPPLEDFSFDDFALIQAKQTNEQPTGFTICIRVKFVIWRDKTLFHIQNKDLVLALSLKDLNTGDLFYTPNHHPLEWKNALDISPFAWNLFCLSYNNEFRNITVMVNTINVYDQNIFINTTELIFPNSKVILPMKYLSETSITDLNIWSRPLFSNDFSMKPNECSRNFFKTNKPEYISWPEAKIIFEGAGIRAGTGIKTTYTTVSEICSDFKTRQVMVYWKNPSNILDAMELCSLWNVDFPKVTSLRNFEQLLNSSRLNSMVYNTDTIWVPAKRATGESNKWIQITKEITTEEVLVDAKIFENDPKKKNDCIYFNTLQRQFSLDSCEEEE